MQPVTTQAVDFHLGLFGLSQQFLLALKIYDGHGHMQARGNTRHRPHPCDPLRPVSQQCITPTQGGTTHAPDMSLKVPGSHELRHHGLSTDFRMPHVQGAAPGKWLNQTLGQYQIPQTQGREHHLAEGADIDHPPLTVQCRQRRQRGPAITVLAVVIVFDDPALITLGPVQQFKAPGQAHGHSCRVLMGRRHVGQPTVAHVRQCRAIHTILIDRDAVHFRPRNRKGMCRCAVAGILDGHPVARLDQQLCTKANSLLRATGDQNLLR